MYVDTPNVQVHRISVVPVTKLMTNKGTEGVDVYIWHGIRSKLIGFFLLGLAKWTDLIQGPM
jgi:hypothetical protein